ncbi:Zinc finger, C2H2-type/integrase, DNA-binding protein [Akanthomyces lecanii RCEF 1005]|uniref:Zinc finger, C2H2-type/integrase, DNA-binding protein n=1 Tax=Akanthomyces lecanii RCEF 1005 TaxID=1081108 RepID=A0A168I6T4_CORDF|nr:Zinc finger, C2H2-type/integrase, DNA-binding protein [Akanthomyces lecanii RCEF 1005]
MDRTASDFPQQTGLPSPYPSNFGGDAHSEASSADHASAQPYPPPPKDAAYPATATPASDYGVYPPPARSTSAYPDHVQRAYQPASSPSTGSMAQQNSPSLPQSDGRNHQASINSDPQVPIDPSIAQPSPTYPYGQHSPYAPNPDMAHSYSHPNSNMYAQPRPEWGGYATQHGAAPLTPGHPVYGQSPASAPQQRPNQVYSFVPIPGAQQHKRPRRRYEEIERMYKCGWNGCEKAYGTLNHLNAHVTMQSHGQKRTPEEFKEIRKEWKARKKEEDALRKADEERQRSQAAANGGQEPGHDGAPAPGYPGSRQVQLPPIGYQNQYPAPPSGVGQPPLPEYGATSHMYPNYQPHSPYGQPSQNMYSQSNGAQPPSH